MRTTILGLLATALLAALLGCGTQNIGAGGSPSRDSAAFKLDVLDDSFVGGASAAGFDISVEDYGRDVMVSIKAEQAVDLKALYASLEYDPARYRPLTAGPARSLPAAEHYLSLDVKSERGRMWYGQVLSNYEWRSGFSGDGVLATAVFRKEPTPLRSISTPPNAPSSATVLTWDGATGLDWYYFSTGDYDQNSEVGLSDLTPLGANFGETHTVSNITTGLSAIDGDQNGELNIADLTPIGANFGKTCSGYNVYSGVAAGDYPDGGTLAGNIAFATAVGGFGGDATAGTRKTLTYEEGGTLAEFYWVKPTDGATDGTPSNLATTNPANMAAFTLTNPPAGGSGTAVDPYIVDDATDYVFSVVDPTDGDVSTSADTNYAPSAGGAMGAGVNTFNITDGFTGDIAVSATYNGLPTNPGAIHLRIPTGGGGGLVILPDPADGDWAGVTGDGSSADPYVCGSGSFNTDTTMVFSLIAQDSVGDPFPGTPTWASNPPFTAIFANSSVPDFVVTMFSNGYAFANDATEGDSNFLYIVYSDLPD